MKMICWQNKHSNNVSTYKMLNRMNVTKSINIAPLITTVKINVLNLPRIKNELRKGETGKGNHHKSIIFF